jgi:hypothetical protein
MVPLLEKFFPVGWSPGQNKLAVHIDNALGHNSRMTQNFFRHNLLKRLPHLPDSPNIFLSDFYLNGTVKSALIKRQKPDEIDLHEGVTDISPLTLSPRRQKRSTTRR